MEEEVGASKTAEVDTLFGSDDEDDEVVTKMQISPPKKSTELEEVFGSDNDDDLVSVPKKGTRDDLEEVFGSDEEDDIPENVPKQETKDDTAKFEDVFGSDDDVDDRKESQATKDSAEMDEIFGSDAEGEKSDSDTEELFGDAPSFKSKVSTTKSIYSIPAVTRTPLGANSIAVQMPNFVKIQPMPYSSATYDSAKESSRFAGATSMVRWRYKYNSLGEVLIDASGKPQIESNARLVRWSDGSMQLIVGSEAFDTSYIPRQNTFLYTKLRSVQPPDHDEDQEPIKEESCLEGVGLVGGRIILQPSSVSSQAHNLMSLKVSEKYRRGNKISTRDYETIALDPYKEKEARAAEENAKIREERKRKMAERNPDTVRRRPAISADYLEAFEEEDSGRYATTSIKSIKNRRAVPVPREDEDDEMNDFIVHNSSEEEGDGDWEEGYEKPSKRRKDDGSEEDESEEEEEFQDTQENSSEEEEEEEEEEITIARRSTTTVTSSVNADDEEGEGEKKEEIVDTRKRFMKRTIVDSDEDD